MNAKLRLECYKTGSVELERYTPDTSVISTLREIRYRLSKGRRAGSRRVLIVLVAITTFIVSNIGPIDVEESKNPRADRTVRSNKQGFCYPQEAIQGNSDLLMGQALARYKVWMDGGGANFNVGVMCEEDSCVPMRYEKDIKGEFELRSQDLKVEIAVQISYEAGKGLELDLDGQSISSETMDEVTYDAWFYTTAPVTPDGRPISNKFELLAMRSRLKETYNHIMVALCDGDLLGRSMTQPVEIVATCDVATGRRESRISYQSFSISVTALRMIKRVMNYSTAAEVLSAFVMISDMAFILVAEWECGVLGRKYLSQASVGLVTICIVFLTTITGMLVTICRIWLSIANRHSVDWCSTPGKVLHLLSNEVKFKKEEGCHDIGSVSGITVKVSENSHSNGPKLKRAPIIVQDSDIPNEDNEQQMGQDRI